MASGLVLFHTPNFELFSFSRSITSILFLVLAGASAANAQNQTQSDWKAISPGEYLGEVAEARISLVLFPDSTFQISLWHPLVVKNGRGCWKAIQDFLILEYNGPFDYNFPKWEMNLPDEYQKDSTWLDVIVRNAGTNERLPGVVVNAMGQTALAGSVTAPDGTARIMYSDTDEFDEIAVSFLGMTLLHIPWDSNDNRGGSLEVWLSSQGNAEIAHYNFRDWQLSEFGRESTLSTDIHRFRIERVPGQRFRLHGEGQVIEIQ